MIAGVAETAITPPVGTPTLGTIQRSTGVHDDLHAKALVLSDGEQRVALLSLDLIGLDFQMSDAIRRAVTARTGTSHVLVHCTHNHSGPFTIPWSVLGPRSLAAKQRTWRESLPHVLGQLAAEATERLQPVTLRAGRAPAQIGLNRRLPSGGSIVMKPNSAGTVVPWVDVLCIDRASGSPMALLVGHAAHPVIIHGASRLLSAEFPGFTAQMLRRELRTDVVVLFAQGCAANINGEPLRGGIAAAQSAGETLGRAVLQALDVSRTIRGTSLNVASLADALPLQRLPRRDECLAVLRSAEQQLQDAYGATSFTDEQLWDLQEDVAAPVSSAASDAANDVQPMEGKAWWMADTVLCLRDLLAKIDAGDERPLRFESTMARVGDEWSIVTATHELFAEYQLRVDRASTTEHTMVLAYTNGCESYVPLDVDLALGGYEAATFPELGGASLRYRHRRALQAGFEQQVTDRLLSLQGAPTGAGRSRTADR
jgi:hypothetical protein